MGENADPARLEMISTRWTLFQRAHQGPGEVAAAAQAELLNRYGGALRRYLLGALKEADTADELFQEFAYRFLHGDLRGACQAKGRFRDFLKGVIGHLVADFCKRRQRQPVPLPEKFPEPAARPEADLDRLFQESWRDELLARTWLALADAERATGQPFHTVLRFRAENPELRSPELAGRLSDCLGRAVSAANVRQLIHRAREKFTELLRLEIADSLATADPEAIDSELEDLGLRAYVG